MISHVINTTWHYGRPYYLSRENRDENETLTRQWGRDWARLQRVQNCLVRVVTKAPRFSCSVLIPKRLYWLLVKFRIYFKICTITFRALKDNQPAYLADLIVRPKCSKYLSSTNSNRFLVLRIKIRLGQELSLYLAQYQFLCIQGVLFTNLYVFKGCFLSISLYSRGTFYRFLYIQGVCFTNFCVFQILKIVIVNIIKY